MNESSIYVQYGCGLSAPQKWINYDASPTLRLQRLPLIGKNIQKKTPFPKNVRYGNIVKGLPHESGAINGVYCSHILEHLAYTECLLALKETYRILHQDGLFRLVLPDLKMEVQKYLSDTSIDASSTFMKKTHLGQESRSRNFKKFMKDWLGNSKHLWMWDYESLESELKKVGFTKIRRARYGDSDDSMFKFVENENRWIDCLGVQAEK